MVAGLRAKGLALRPHVKAHKIPQISALQLEAGAIGLTAATIGEAEVFAAHGAMDIFVAYPSRPGGRHPEMCMIARGERPMQAMLSGSLTVVFRHLERRPLTAAPRRRS